MANNFVVRCELAACVKLPKRQNKKFTASIAKTKVVQ